MAAWTVPGVQRGFLVAAAVTVLQITPPLGLHGGLVGLAPNLAIAAGGSPIVRGPHIPGGVERPLLSVPSW